MPRSIPLAFGPGSIWNTAIGSKAKFVPANLYSPSEQPMIDAGHVGPSKAQCANMTKNFAQRLPALVPTLASPRACAAKGCCFSTLHCNVPCPWCFTPTRQAGPGEFHNDADHFVAVKASDPEVTWYMQGWWGIHNNKGVHASNADEQLLPLCKTTRSRAFSERKIRLPNLSKSSTLEQQTATTRYQCCSPTTSQPQTQPAYRCEVAGPFFSLTNGTGPYGVGGPQTYPLTVDITSSSNVGVNSTTNTALGAHGGSGLSAVGGVIRLHEIAPADGAPIDHALKLELFAREYYYGGGSQQRKLQPVTEQLWAHPVRLAGNWERRVHLGFLRQVSGTAEEQS